ncbi:hypothetical protein FOWG_14796 [Fusarium oxysporum f. sp. lycopersici MN25]|nr:hypothetical protein FOWG_14796 [Fusarium oxysporum f. sp. lycopersici MN25]
MSSTESPATPEPVAAPEPYSIFDKLSGFASNIYFPALPTIAHDLDVSIELINLTVTSYLIFQGLAPSLWGPISDVKGRRLAYSLTFIVFLGACIGLAEAKNYATMVVLRCIQSTGSASTIAIGSGVIGDITTRDNRGGLMGIFQAGLLVPVAVGPIIGAKYPLRVYQKTTKVQWNCDAVSTSPAAKKRIDVTGPFRILISKQAAPIIVFLAVYYAVWQMSITAMSSLFEDKYGLTETQIGLAFIANGVGSMVGTLITGKILNLDYRRFKARHDARIASSNTEDDVEPVNTRKAQENDFPLETARLRLVPLFSLLQCASILLFGWTIQYPHRVHIAVPIVSTFITGWSAVSMQSVVMTYLVDVFHDRSAAASASLNLARCLFAAGGTSFVMPMINSIGVGLAFTVCVAVQGVAMTNLAIQWKFGAKWRRAADDKKATAQVSPHS